MKTKIIIGIMSGIGGAALGSLATYFLMEKKCKKIYNKSYADGWHDGFYEHDSDDSLMLHSNVASEPPKINVSLDTDEFRDSFDRLKEAIREYDGSSIEADKPLILERHSDRPFIIDEESFVSACPEYDKLSFEYYHDDDTLCDGSEVVESPQRFIGDISLDAEYHTKLEDAIYIRNDALCADIEIVFNNGSYSENVLGIVVDDDEEVGGFIKNNKIRREFDDGYSE